MHRILKNTLRHLDLSKQHLWSPWPGHDLWEAEGSEVTILRDWDTLLHSSEAYRTLLSCHSKISLSSFSHIYKMRDWNKTQTSQKWVILAMKYLNACVRKEQKYWRTPVGGENQDSPHFYLVLLKWKPCFPAAAHKAVDPGLIYPTIATPPINFLCCWSCKCSSETAESS